MKAVVPTVNVRISNMAAAEPCVTLNATFDCRTEAIRTNKVNVKWNSGMVLTISRDTVFKLIRERYQISDKTALMVKYSLPDRGEIDYQNFPKELGIFDEASDEEAKVGIEGPHNINVKVQGTMQQESSDEGVCDDSQNNLDALLKELESEEEYEDKDGDEDEDVDKLYEESVKNS